MTSARWTLDDIPVRDTAHVPVRATRSPHVAITIARGTATLTGQVSSWTGRRAIEQAAFDAPGVVRVDNRLEVLPAVS